jgi:putative peptidoglycan lipid II flippase
LRERIDSLLNDRARPTLSKKLKNIGVVSFLTVVSRVLGLARDTLSADIFGASVLNSAFLTAFRLPNLFRRLLGEGSLTAAFLPTLQHELHDRGRPGAFVLLNQVSSWLAIVTGGLAVGAMLLLDHSRAIAPGLADRWYLIADLSVLLFPYLAFVCLAAALNATLNVFEHFTEPALSPIWLNLSMIATLGGAGLHFAKTPLGEMHWLCAGVLIGGSLQLAVPAAVLVKLGWKPRVDFSLSPRVLEIGRLMAPGFFGSAIYQVNLYVSSLLAYSLNDFAGTLIFYAGRLMELPIGVFAIAISTVVYPLIARHAVQKNYSGMADDYRKGLRLILVVNVPAAVGLGLLSQPIVGLLFRHGKFTPADAHMMAPLLMLYVVGLPFFSIVNLTVRAFYSLKDTSSPVKVAAVDFCVNLGLSLLLMRWLGVFGLVLASTAAIVVQTVLLQRSLARKLVELKFAPLWPSVAKVLLAALGMGVLVWAARLLVTGMALGVRTTEALEVLALIPAGAVVYGVLLWLLRIEGREELAALVQKKLPWFANREFPGKS